MLQKRIDLGSQPFGLAIAGEDLVKGMAVVVRVEDGVLKAFKPSTEAEADEVMGFVTFRIEEAGKADKDFDVLKAGSRVVIYTLVKNNMWATTEFVDGAGVVADADMCVEFTGANAGKLMPVGATGRKPLFRVYGKSVAGAGYTDAMVNVLVK